MRIVQVIPYFEPTTIHGGPMSVVAGLSRILAQRGHQVQVVTTDLGIDTSVPRDCWVKHQGYQVWYGKVGPWSRRPPYWTPTLRRPLRDALAQAQVLHLQAGLTLLNALAARLARRRGLPYVYTAHGLLSPYLMRRLTKKLFAHWVERRVIRHAAALQALTEDEKQQIITWGGAAERIHIIPNGVELADPQTWPDRQTFRREHGIPSHATLILFLSRLMRMKGLDLLIEAMVPLRREFPDLHLALVGHDFRAESNNARRQVISLGLHDVVHFPGPVSGNQRSAAYRAADLFALPSFSEGLPLAVLEACGMGLPVLISPDCHLPQVATYQAGLIVPPQVGALVDALRQMLQDTPALRCMGDNARHMVRDGFELEQVASHLEKLYQSLTAT